MTSAHHLVPLLMLAAGPAFAQGAPNPSFNLVNRSQSSIREFFATPSGFNNWGQNRLAGKTIAPGEKFAVRLRADGNCRYDLRVVTNDGKVEDRKDVDTCRSDDVVFGGAAPPAATGRPGPLRLTNNGNSPITEFYERKAGSSDWGPNRFTLGNQHTVIAPQGTIALPPPGEGGCSYDLRVVFENKQSRERKAADLCRLSELPVQ